MRRIVCAAALVACLTGCDPELLPPPAAVSFVVTGDNALASLSERARLRLTVGIDGLLAESPLTLEVADGSLTGRGYFEISIESQQQSTLAVRLYGTDDDRVLDPNVILLERSGPLTLEQALNTVELSIAPDDAEVISAGTPVFDQNNNGDSNLVDLQNGCSPGAPPPLVRLANGLVDFPTAGDATVRSLVVPQSGLLQAVDATPVDTAACGTVHPEAVRVESRIFDAPGTMFERLVNEATSDGPPVTRSELSRSLVGDSAALLDPLQQDIANVVFNSPQDARVTGGIFFEATHCRCRYTTQVRATVVANAQFPPGLPPPGYVPADDVTTLPDSAVLPVAFPTDLLFSGGPLPVTVGPAAATVGSLPAGTVYAVDVPAGHVVNALLTDVSGDLDLAAIPVGPDGGLLVADEVLSQHVGASDEAVQAPAASAPRIVLIVVGRPAYDADDRNRVANLVIHAYGGPELFGAPVPFALAATDDGSTDRTVTVSGARLDADALVFLGGQLAPNVAVDETGSTMTFTAPSVDLLSTPVPADVRVEHPGGLSATLPASFVFGPGGIELTGVSPPSVVPGGTFHLFANNISDLYGRPLVRVGGVDAPVLQVTDTFLLVAAPVGPGPGLVEVEAENVSVAGLSSAPSTLSGALTYLDDDMPGEPPALISIDPPTGNRSGNYLVVLTGTGFLPGAEVLFGPEQVPATVLDETTLQFTAPAVEQIGQLFVYVRNPGGLTSNALPFVATGGLCGNGIIDGTEQCDLTQLGPHTCQTFGYEAGVLSCNPATCTFNFANCGDCGDGKRDIGEQCDGTDLGGFGCTDFAFDKGQLGCGDMCTYDFSQCAFGFCGDQQCDADEDGTSCPEDCLPSCGQNGCTTGETCASCPAECGVCTMEVVGGNTSVVAPIYGAPVVAPQVRVVTPATGGVLPHNAGVNLEVQSQPLGWGASLATAGAVPGGLYDVNIEAGRMVGQTGEIVVGAGPGVAVAGSVTLSVQSEDVPVGTIVSVLNPAAALQHSTGNDVVRGLAYRPQSATDVIERIHVAPNGDIVFARSGDSFTSGQLVRIDGNGIVHPLGLAGTDRTGVGGVVANSTLGDFVDFFLDPDGNAVVLSVEATSGLPVLSRVGADITGALDNDASDFEAVPFDNASATTRQIALRPDGDVLLVDQGNRWYVMGLDTGTVTQTAGPCSINSTQNGSVTQHLAYSRTGDPEGEGLLFWTSACAQLSGLFSHHAGRGATIRLLDVLQTGVSGMVYAPGAGSVFVATNGNQVARVWVGGSLTPLTGTFSSPGGDHGPALDAPVSSPSALAVDENTGDVYVVTNNARRIRMIRGIGLEPSPFTLTLTPNENGVDSGDGQSDLPTVQLPVALKTHLDGTVDGAPANVSGAPVHFRGTASTYFGRTVPYVDSALGLGNTQAVVTLGLEPGAHAFTAAVVDPMARPISNIVTFDITIADPPPGTLLRAVNHDAVAGINDIMLPPFPPAPIFRFNNFLDDEVGMVTHQGTVLLAEGSRNRILQMFPDGHLDVFGGGGVDPSNGIPLDIAQLPGPTTLALDGDVLYVMARGDDQVRRIDLSTPDRLVEAAFGGTITAPLVLADVPSDPGLAVDAFSVTLKNLDNNGHIAALDGALYYSPSTGTDTNAVFKIENGLVHRWAENVECGPNLDIVRISLRADPASGRLFGYGTCFNNAVCPGSTPTVFELVDDGFNHGVIANPVPVDEPASCGGNLGRYGITVGPDGAVYVAETVSDAVYRIDVDAGTSDRVVGNLSQGYGPVAHRLSTSMYDPAGLAFLGNDLYIADTRNYGIRVVKDLIGDLP